MTLIKAIRNFIMTCDLLEDGALLKVDTISDEAVEYSINPIPSEVVIKEFITGDSLRQFQFAFVSRNLTAETMDYIENNGFYETFSDWLETQTDAENFPILEDDKKEPQSIKALNAGFLFGQDSSQETAVYQIICLYIYRQKGA